MNVNRKKGVIRKISAVLFTCCVAFVFADNLFVIGAYDIADTNLFTWISESLHLNTIRSSWIDSQDAIEKYLMAADKKGIKVILDDVGVDRLARLSRYYYLWQKVWESDSAYVFHNTGSKVFDGSAFNHYSWKCSVNHHSAGLMQYGPSGWQAQIQTHYTMPTYIARFRLKIDDEQCCDTVKVCSLIVQSRSDQNITSVVDTVLRVRDFPRINEYSYFELPFTKSPVDRSAYQYLIWWFGNVDLWSDYIEVSDDDIGRLTAGLFDDSLKIIFSSYKQYPALSYYYLKDELLYGQFTSNKYLMHYLREHHSKTPGIQALGGQGMEHFQLYSDIVKPYVLMFDKYPIRDNTPKSGPIFQKALDELCVQLSDMRTVALAETLDFWFIVQAFGRYESTDRESGGSARSWRLPTPEELHCMTWLGLAYGAKGIFYYCFESRIEDDFYLRGLWRFDHTPREPLFSEVRKLNQVIESIGPILLTLTSGSVFKSKNIPSHGVINSISPECIAQFGTFHDDHSDAYLIVVNRHCHLEYLEKVSFGLDDRYLLIKDIYTNEVFLPDSATSGSTFFSVPFKSGEGRCFKLIP